MKVTIELDTESNDYDALAIAELIKHLTKRIVYHGDYSKEDALISFTKNVTGSLCHLKHYAECLLKGSGLSVVIDTTDKSESLVK